FWIGVSGRIFDKIFRIKDLYHVAGAVRFVTCEPFLAPLDSLPLEGIEWVADGGESGAKARPMHPDWASSFRKQCKSRSRPFSNNLASSFLPANWRSRR